MTGNPSTPRADQIYHEQRAAEHAFTDRLFAGLMVIQFIGCIIIAYLISPRTWIGAQSTLHIHIWASIGIGSVVTILPVVLAIYRPGHVITRHVIAASQAMYSALLIHLMGGRIEAHFHVFGSLAFLAFYRDIRVILTATAVTAVDHFTRGVFWPESVFGIFNASNWRWVEHAAWVIFEDLFLVISIIRIQRQSRTLAEATASLENQKGQIEAEVLQRTEQLQIALAEAKAAELAKSDFLANMSHEIRTPMTAILGYADLLNEEEDQQAIGVDQAVRSINANAKHLLTLIDDILDVSKIDAGQMKIERIQTRPDQIIEEVIAIITPLANDKGLHAHAVYSSLMPEMILTDPTRFKQILLNLAGNALKFTERGSVAVNVACDEVNEKLLISVIDTGIGMNEQQVREIGRFEAFNQADASMSRRFGGSGLGLRISNALARKLGSGIEIDSIESVGSTFRFTLDTGSLAGVKMVVPGEPTSKETSKDQPKKQAEPTKPTEHDKQSLPLDGVSILLAEDGRDNQRLISFHLKKAGAEVLICDNGQIACNTIEDGDPSKIPDVVLMDMQMPELDGYGATQRLRDKGYTELPIIALTAHAMAGDREKCISAGCNDYLTKPIDKQTLIKTCTRYSNVQAASSSNT